jgi:hypothetical protein
MVDDQNLRVLHPPPGLIVEALLVGRALAAETVAVLALGFVPNGRMRMKVEIGQ